MSPSMPSHLSERELKAMMAVWKAGKPCSAKEILATSNLGWPAQSMQTQLLRLQQKGWLCCDRTKSPYRYTPAVSWEQYQENELDKMFRFYDSNKLDFYTSLYKRGVLDKEIIKELLRLTEEQD